MKRKLNNSVRVAATPFVESIDDSLHLTRGAARRETAKFREYRERFADQPHSGAAVRPLSALGRHDE